MNPLVLQNPDRVNSYSQPQIDGYSGAQILDGVTQSFIKFDDWVARELDRIGHNKLPRNCYSYEALTSVVESVSQVDQCCRTPVYYPPLLHEPPYQRSLPCPDRKINETQKTQRRTTPTYINNEQQENSIRILPFDPLDYGTVTINDISDDIPSFHDPTLTVEPDTPLDPTSLAIDQLTQNNLTLAFTHLIYFCQHEPMKFHLQHHRKPLELLIQLENAFEVFSEWYPSIKQFGSSETTDGAEKQRHINPSIDTADVQTKLANILFGENIPISNKLLSSWTMISLWVRQGQHILNIKSNVKLRQEQLNEQWIQFGAVSYYIAKRACGISKSNISNN